MTVGYVHGQHSTPQWLGHPPTHLGLPYGHGGRSDDHEDMTGTRDAQCQDGLLERDSHGLRASSIPSCALCSCGVEEVMFNGPDGRSMGCQGSAREGHIMARSGIGSQETGLVGVLSRRRDRKAIMRNGDLDGG